KLYRYENMLYTISLKGSEIDGFLEHSAAGWFNNFTQGDPYLLNYRRGPDGKPLVSADRLRLREPVYNFDSAAGIDYTVDVTLDPGNRVVISGLSDGRAFHIDSTYSVAINSYRASGGGGHIRTGAGLSSEEALARLLKSTSRDLRYYMIEWISEKRILEPLSLNNWKVVPEAVTVPAIKREWQLVYGNN
ncbi:MAG: bifunctional metallophosphatase/5'-nucleotidase, partial [Bacteroidetes bacterium]|nr:bifunctional metallophosphatase/5'-nucleotidase [Bacteroidota bacterium]